MTGLQALETIAQERGYWSVSTACNSAWKVIGVLLVKAVRELKIPEGKGYRVYYAWDGPTIVLLLCGGDKSTQNADIENAKAYWRDYNERK